MTVIAKPSLKIEDAASGMVLHLSGAWITSAAISLNSLCHEAAATIQAKRN
jgi:hypothetical protein